MSEPEWNGYAFVREDEDPEAPPVAADLTGWGTVVFEVEDEPGSE